ncbi:MAG: acetylornithine deacetylase [Porticoccaceae bacterium]|nr:acetylornithine deacetylase [Porticoccaceae bacterium]
MKLEQMIQNLIATNSISSTSPGHDHGNLEVIEMLAQWLDDLGFATEIMRLDHPHKANLIATYGSGSGGLVLAGHSDTVPCDEALWQQNPFKLTERDGRFYGLGAADMKSFFALAIEAFKPLADQHFKQPLIILATADEESSMSGAMALVEAGKPVARRALIGEPTSMKPIVMHKGIMVESLSIQGQSGHSSNPHLGRNALQTLQKVLTELCQIQAELRAQYRSPLFAVDYPTLNLGCVHGGDNHNRICGHCELDFEIRPLPGMDVVELQHMLNARLLPLGEAEGTPITLKNFSVPSFASGDNSALAALCKRLTGQPPEAVAFATEAPFLQQLGMDVVVMGPGNIDQAHQPNEYLGLAQINPAVELIRKLIIDSCLQETLSEAS